MTKKVIGFLVRRLGWMSYAIAFRDGNAERVAKCQTPDWSLYGEDFKIRRAVR